MCNAQVYLGAKADVAPPPAGSREVLIILSLISTIIVLIYK